MTKCEGIVGKCGDFEVDSGPDRKPVKSVHDIMNRGSGLLL